MISTLTEPEQHALSAAQAALDLVHVLFGASEGATVPEAAHKAAETALRAALAVYLILASPGHELDYYVAAAAEIAVATYTDGRTASEAVEAFYADGWQYTDAIRPGHSPMVEDNPDGFIPICVGCGWIGRLTRTRHAAGNHALDHACWTVAPRLPR